MAYVYLGLHYTVSCVQSSLHNRCCDKFKNRGRY